MPLTIHLPLTIYLPIPFTQDKDAVVRALEGGVVAGPPAKGKKKAAPKKKAASEVREEICAWVCSYLWWSVEFGCEWVNQRLCTH